MTFVSFTFSGIPYPISKRIPRPFNICTSFVLGRYTNMIYTLTAAFIVSLVDVFIFGNSIIYGITLIVIAGIVSAVGPFLKQNDIISLLILNLISIIILLF